MAVTKKDAAALTGAPDPAPDVQPDLAPDASALPFISAGMAHDLSIHGHATDPNTGKRVVQDADGTRRVESAE